MNVNNELAFVLLTLLNILPILSINISLFINIFNLSTVGRFLLLHYKEVGQ